jgi:hypothetical protein
MNRAPRLLVALAAVVISGCSTPKKEDGPPRPIRFAVIAAPEVGANDDDLAAAIGMLSREPDLDFVLVPGPLLAKEADAIALELLKNDLGQLAPPVYVSFAAVGSGTATLKATEILAALEKMGPGEEHAVAYLRTPPRQQGLNVNVVGPDGKSPLEKRPEGKRVVTLGAANEKFESDLEVRVGDPGPADDRVRLDPRSPRGTLAVPSSAPGWCPPTLRVPPLQRSKLVVLVTVYPRRLEVQPVALQGPNPPALEPLELVPPP